MPLDKLSLLPVLSWGTHTHADAGHGQVREKRAFRDLVNESLSLNVKLTNRTACLCPFALSLVFFGYGSGKSGQNVNCKGEQQPLYPTGVEDCENPVD